MMNWKKLKKTAALSALAFVSLSATAQRSAPPYYPYYAEFGYTMITYKESGYKADPGVLRAILGADVTPNLSFEAMLGTGITEGSTRSGNVTVTSDVDRFFGFYAKPKVMVTPGLELFGRLGYASSKVTASVPGFAVSDSGDSTSLGAGLNLKITSNSTLNLDYMSYYNKNSIKATGFTVGYGFKFR